MAIQAKIMESFVANNTKDLPCLPGAAPHMALWQGDTSILQNSGGLH